MKKHLFTFLFTTLFIVQPFQAQGSFFDFFSSGKNDRILQKKIKTMIKKADQKENLGKRTKKYLEILKVITTQPGSQKIKEGLFKKTKKQLLDILKNNDDVDQSTIDDIKEQIFKLKKQLKKKQLKKNSKPTSSTFASKIKKAIAGFGIAMGILVIMAAAHNNSEYGGGGQGGNNDGGAGGKGGSRSNEVITPDSWPVFNVGDGTGSQPIGGQNNNILLNGAPNTDPELIHDQEDQDTNNSDEVAGGVTTTTITTITTPDMNLINLRKTTKNQNTIDLIIDKYDLSIVPKYSGPVSVCVITYEKKQLADL